MKIFRTAVLSLAAVSLLAIPAYAKHDDDRHDRGWHRGHDRHYHKHRHGHHHRHRDRVIVHRYYQAAPVYAAPVYDSRVVCYSQSNPLPVLLGGVAGGAIGSSIGKGSGRTAAIITGAVLGAGLGSAYTVSDQYCTREAFETVPLGQPVYWQNGDTGYHVTPTQEYRTADRYCREYQAIATVGNRRQETYGTACRQPDGSWEIVN